MSPGFGAFGKIPALGDFFRLNAATEFVTVWDEWLQGILHEARARFSASWDACYLSAPIWRFSLAAGLAGKDPVIGILMASVDRVGRQFPLTLMCPQSGTSPFRNLFTQDQPLTALENLALDALDDDMTRDRLGEGLAGIVPASGADPAAIGQRHGGLVVAGADPAALLPDIATYLGGAMFTGTSIWTTVVDGKARLMTCTDLPDISQASGLFDLAAPIWTSGQS